MSFRPLVVSVIGTRPEIVKMYSIIKELDAEKRIQHKILHTGQHYDYNMSKIFFKDLDIRHPDVFLNAKTRKTQVIAEKAKEFFIKEKPAIVVVQGDTNSALAVAKTARELHIKIVHIEAGCRSYSDRLEEKNRIQIDRISDLLVCADSYSVECLIKEGFNPTKIIEIGRTSFSAIEAMLPKLEKSKINKLLDVQPNSYILFTLHRMESTTPGRLKKVLKAMDEVAVEFPVVFPVHPRTRKVIEKHNIFVKNIKLLPPLGYIDFLKLLSNARVVVSDSGGVQEEAAFFGIPDFVLLDKTEWVELLYPMGKNVLVSPENLYFVVRNAMFYKSAKTGYPMVSLFREKMRMDFLRRDFL